MRNLAKKIFFCETRYVVTKTRPTLFTRLSMATCRQWRHFQTPHHWEGGGTRSRYIFDVWPGLTRQHVGLWVRVSNSHSFSSDGHKFGRHGPLPHRDLPQVLDGRWLWWCWLLLLLLLL